jgi:hypothetical protein
MQTAVHPTVRVDMNRRGEWEVALPDGADVVRCRTIRDAMTIANRCAADHPDCEIIFHDAYHRVLHRKRSLTAATPGA